MVSMQLNKKPTSICQKIQSDFILLITKIIKAYTTEKCTVAGKETKLRAFKSVTKLRLRNTKRKKKRRKEFINNFCRKKVRKSRDTQIHQYK